MQLNKHSTRRLGFKKKKPRRIERKKRYMTRAGISVSNKGDSRFIYSHATTQFRANKTCHIRSIPTTAWRS
jgi:uncharacterized protein YigE (DUF2233 family)